LSDKDRCESRSSLHCSLGDCMYNTGCECRVVSSYLRGECVFELLSGIGSFDKAAKSNGLLLVEVFSSSCEIVHQSNRSPSHVTKPLSHGLRAYESILIACDCHDQFHLAELELQPFHLMLSPKRMIPKPDWGHGPFNIWAR
jgi:hypothetical protein